MTRHERYIDSFSSKWSMQKIGIYKHMRNYIRANSDMDVSWLKVAPKPLPDLWEYRPASSFRPYHTYEWHEVVDTNDLSKPKLLWLYWLKDWIDGVKFYDEAWLDIVFYKHDVSTSLCKEFDPFEISYEWLTGC